jgi:hypothetical protein
MRIGLAQDSPVAGSCKHVSSCVSQRLLASRELLCPMLLDTWAFHRFRMAFQVGMKSMYFNAFKYKGILETMLTF